MPCANHPEVLNGLNACARCAKKFCYDCLVELKGGRFCAVCKSEQVKDIKSGVEGTELPLAGIGRRFAAVFLDGLVMMLVIVPVAFAGGMFAASRMEAGDEAGVGVQLILQVFFMGIGLVYEGVMIGWKGATLGKMALGVRVVAPDGSPATPGQAWIRALVKSLMGFCWLVDYIPAFFRKDKCCIHDMAARTRVVAAKR